MGHLFSNSSHKTSSSDGFETTVWVTKVVLMTVGVVSCLFLFRIAVIPSVSSFLVSTLPCLWNILRSFLSPPYVYILVNFIILSIALSSSFHHQTHFKNPKKIKTLYQDDEFEAQEVILVHQEDEETLKKQIVVEPSIDITSSDSSDVIFPGKAIAISRESSAEEKQIVMVEHPEPEEDSLDSIWKNIMEGQAKKPQLKKCDTWNSPPNLGRAEAGLKEAEVPAVCAKREMRKCETFIRREKMLSQDELNLRADAFIKKFNREMKLEREESHLRYMETVNRGLVDPTELR